MRGTDVEGDIAIDAIRITPGPCSGEGMTSYTSSHLNNTNVVALTEFVLPTMTFYYD